MDAASPVRTRRVHYFSGFDPRGARHYHQLYREEAAKQAVHHSGSITVGERKTHSQWVKAWLIESDWPEGKVSTEYQFMEWDDIARKHWGGRLPQVFREAFPVYFTHLSSGAWKKTTATCPTALYCGLYPWIYFLLSVGVACLVGGLTQMAMTILLRSMLWGLLAGAVATLAALVGAAFLSDRVGVPWLLRTYKFVQAWGDGEIPELRERLKGFADQIVKEQRTNPVDEVLIVGHSVGTIAVVCSVAEMLRATEPLPAGFHLLTLGNCIPFLSLNPVAGWFREDLTVLFNDHQIEWTNATVPSDPLGFYGANLSEGIVSALPNRPRQILARIFRMFSPAVYARFRRNKLRIHFQYLMASELPSSYDYFHMTAGPEKLASRSFD